MSREIKFRAWDKKDKVMVDFSHPYLAVVGERIRNYSLGYDSEGNYRQQENIIYMQYTGLKDKNDVEIYEGDILRFSEGDCRAVSYDYERTGFKLASEDPVNPLWQMHKFMEVIGNIYETPELLEAEL